MSAVPSQWLYNMRCCVIAVTSYQQNSSLLHCESSGEGVSVDPRGDVDRILEVVAESGAEIEKIFLAHGHMNHVAGTDGLIRRLAGSMLRSNAIQILNNVLEIRKQSRDNRAIDCWSNLIMKEKMYS